MPLYDYCRSVNFQTYCFNHSQICFPPHNPTTIFLFPLIIYIWFDSFNTLLLTLTWVIFTQIMSWSWAPSTINLALTPLTSELSRLTCQVALVVKNPPTNAWDIRDTGSFSEPGRFPWRKGWQPTPIFLPEKSHGQRNLTKCQTWLKQLSMP